MTMKAPAMAKPVKARSRIQKYSSMMRPERRSGGRFQAFPGRTATPPGLFAAKQRLGGGFGGALGRPLGFQPGDLFAQQGNPLGQFVDGQQREILADLMRAWLLPGFVVEDRHRRSSLTWPFA